MSETSKEQLESNVKSVAEDIEQLAQGLRYCPDCGEFTEKIHCCDEEEETISLLGYLQDSLYIKLTTELDGSLLGARITVADGGPAIHINTNSGYVEGYWGMDEYRVRLSDFALEKVYDTVQEMRY